MLKANGKYDKSNEWMTKFASMRPADVRAIAFNENPDYLPKILEKGKKFNVQNLEINSKVSDFGGTLKNGKLYITSARNNARREYGWNEQPFLDLYEFTVEDDGTYQNESLLGNDINTKYHEGVVAFSPDGNTMYFSRESFYEKEYQKDSLSNTRFSVLNLFKATKSGNDWSNVEPLPFNSNNYNTDHPSVSADGKTLYFTSDMPGGFGQGDIYKTTINSDGSFGEAKNLGQKIYAINNRTNELEKIYPSVGEFVREHKTEPYRVLDVLYYSFKGCTLVREENYDENYDYRKVSNRKPKKKSLKKIY